MAPLLVIEVHFGGENNISLFLKSQAYSQVSYFKVHELFSQEIGELSLYVWMQRTIITMGVG